MGKILDWLQERVKQGTKPASSLLMHRHTFRSDAQLYRSGCRKCLASPAIDRTKTADQTTTANQP